MEIIFILIAIGLGCLLLYAGSKLIHRVTGRSNHLKALGNILFIAGFIVTALIFAYFFPLKSPQLQLWLIANIVLWRLIAQIFTGEKVLPSESSASKR